MTSTYKATTYAAAATWLEDTKVQYVPNPKRGKSFVRYGGYEKSKTVGEALANGSWASDLLFDYEHGLLKVSPPFRKNPLDVSKISNFEDLTETDLVILKFAVFVDPSRAAVSERIKGEINERLARARQVRRRVWRLKFANAFGMENADDLGDAKGFWECGETWARRSVAEKEAQDILHSVDKDGRKITDYELLRVLRLWGFRQNETRKNVMQPGQTFISSDTLGLTTDRTGHTIKREETRLYAGFNTLVARWLHDNLPEELQGKFFFTSVNINKNYNARLHRDNNNVGPSIIKAFGEFEEGELTYYPEDDRKTMRLDQLPQLPPSARTKLDISEGTLLFDGNRAHAVDDFKGERFSVVYFTCARYWKASAEDRKVLTGMGFKIPEKSALAKIKATMAPPLGLAKKTKSAAAGKSASMKRAIAARRAGGPITGGFKFWPVKDDAAKQKRERYAAKFWAKKPPRKVIDEAEKVGGAKLTMGFSSVKRKDRSGVWDEHLSFKIGDTLTTQKNLELKGVPNVADAVIKLNDGGETAAIKKAGYCFVFSNRTKSYYVVYRLEKRDKVLAAFKQQPVRRGVGRPRSGEKA